MPYKILDYDRVAALEYAEKWAYRRNPSYYNFDGIGGDCTNFASQCLYAGARTMNYTPVFGWYYIDADRRAPAWTGVEYFYNFLTQNKSVGPQGFLCLQSELLPGDFIQLKNGGRYTHTLLVITVNPRLTLASHTEDAYMRPLENYRFDSIRCLQIEKVLKWI